MKIIIFITIALALCGCQTTQPQNTVDIAPLSRQIESLSGANSDLRVANERLTTANSNLLAANEQLKATLRADADAGLAANTKGWLPFEKYVWGHQLQLLPVAPDAGTTAKWTEASTLYAAGGESAMQGVVNDLTTQAGQLNTKLGELAETAKTAQAERDSAQKLADESMHRAQKAEQDLADAVSKAKADEVYKLEKEAKEKQVSLIISFGGYAAVGALIAAVGIYWIGEGAVVACIVLALSSMVLFGYARLLDWPYYGWCVGIIITLSIIGLIVYLVRVKKNKEKAATVEPIINAIDAAYDECDTAGKAVIDTHILKRLADLGPSFDASIKRIKADICDKQS